MIRLMLNGQELVCEDCAEVLDRIRANGRFTAKQSLPEYVEGLKKRILNYYGDNVERLGYWGLVRYLKDRGEIKVEGV